MTTATTSTSAAAWSPDVTAFAPQDVIPDALVLQASTVSGAVEGDEPAVRVAYVDDAPAGFVPEGDDIDESDPELNEVLVHTGKIAVLVKVSREQWLQTQTSGLLSASVARAVTKAGNAAFIAQAIPTPPAVTPPAGLIHIPGILDTFDPIGDDLDPLSDAITQIEENGGDVTHILASPSAWGYLRKLKVGVARNDTLLGAGAADIEKRLLGIRVITTPAIPPGGLLPLDKFAIPSAVGNVLVAVSEHYYFNSDSIALRCTWRFGANLVRPNRVAYLNIDDPS